jgi:hypothetical protein
MSPTGRWWSIGAAEWIFLYQNRLVFCDSQDIRSNELKKYDPSAGYAHGRLGSL